MRVDQLRVQIIRDLPDNHDAGDLFTIINDAQEEFQLMRRWGYYQKKGTIVLDTPYTTGTVAVTNNSNAITGTSTVWTAAMTGSNFQLGGESTVYQFTFVSTTTGTLDRVYSGDTASAKDYTIYTTNYDLPADFDRVVHIQNARTLVILRSVVLRHQIDGDYFHHHHQHHHHHHSGDPNSAESYALWGQNSARRQIRLLYTPVQTDTLDVYYMRTTVDVDNIDDSLDVPSGAEKVIKQSAQIRYLTRMLNNSGDAAQGIATSIGILGADRAKRIAALWSRDVNEGYVTRSNRPRVLL